MYFWVEVLDTHAPDVPRWPRRQTGYIYDEVSSWIQSCHMSVCGGYYMPKMNHKIAPHQMKYWKSVSNDCLNDYLNRDDVRSMNV